MIQESVQSESVYVCIKSMLLLLMIYNFRKKRSFFLNYIFTVHPAVPAAVGSRRGSYDMWPADVPHGVKRGKMGFRKTEGVTEEERKEGNEKQLDRKQSSSQNKMHLRNDRDQRATSQSLMPVQ